ncbi:gluconokinase [Chelatococcus reniformis]|uniref:Gluconokinase n=1 Tax=Chelatococcus reniformis TaxID=1494448 RepID=A0A916U2F8_9HYPH|nr:gluconokinase [Chelatococcus reniformis]GGC54349.1 gluconokinase [Chelatococcus reniformis]
MTGSAPEHAPATVIVMGVSGSGKTTIGTLLAQRLGWDFLDADALHPAANVAKMRAGVPLTDADRAPWLAALAAWIDRQRDTGTPSVLACSALRRVYRDALVRGAAEVRVVHLTGPAPLIAARMGGRSGHFMPASLLQDQLDTLQAPSPGERALTVSVEPAPDEIVTDIIRGLGLRERTEMPPGSLA